MSHHEWVVFLSGVNVGALFGVLVGFFSDRAASWSPRGEPKP